MQLDVFVHGDFELIVKRLAAKDLKRLGITSEIPRKVCSLGTKNAVRVLTGASEIWCISCAATINKRQKTGEKQRLSELDWRNVDQGHVYL